MERHQTPSDLYGLIGWPLEHSFSKDFFAGKFSNEGIDAAYRNYPLPAPLQAADLYKVLLLNGNLRGFNVTAPHKESILPFLDSMTPIAVEAGAVNTVRVVRDETGRILRLEGTNTDVEGFSLSIQPLVCDIQPDVRGALVLGTGGAAKAVATAMVRLGFDVLAVSRNPDHFFEEAQHRGIGVTSYGQITADMLHQYPVVINATPCGTYPAVDSAPDIPYHLLGRDNVCFDLVYNPPQSLFLQKSLQRGATVKNGLEMLHNQALLAWEFWNS